MYHQFLGPPNFWRELLTCTSANTTAHTYTNSPKHCVCLSQTLFDVRWRLHRVRCVRLLACIPLADCAEQCYAALARCIFRTCQTGHKTFSLRDLGSEQKPTDSPRRKWKRSSQLRSLLGEGSTTLLHPGALVPFRLCK